MKTFVVDANIFLRLFVKEDIKLLKKAKEILLEAKKEKIKLIVPQIIIFEVNYTLLKYYGFGKNQVAEALNSIVSNSFLEIESKNVFLGAIEMYKNLNLDLTDCFLVEKARIEDFGVKSFDKKLMKNANYYI